jgi:hypothetical protein
MRGSAILSWAMVIAPLMTAVVAAESPGAPGTQDAATDTAAAAPDPATPAEADAEKPPEKKASPIEVTGFIDAYYGYNFNRPAGDTQLRNFDTKHNELSLNLIEVALEQKPTSDSRLGFRTDLNFGPATEMVHAFEPGGADVFRSFEQAYVSGLAPLGKGLQVDFGKFVTQHGAEVIEAKDNWNYSRSLLFSLAIPYYHVGVRAAYPVSDKLSLAGYFVNGWNAGVDNNGGKTFGFQATVKPTSRLTLIQNLMTGPEQLDDNDSNRFLSDTIATLNVTTSLSLMANYDYGRDTVAGQAVKWQGIAGYIRYQINDAWAIAPRFEYLKDSDGFMSGTSQTLKELTLTTEHKMGRTLLTRLEYRRDFSDTPFFLRTGGAAKKSQDTFTIGLVYAFAARI